MSTLPWHSLPRADLGHWPTPLQPMSRLSAELGGPNIWVKRDDCTGLAIGGNKTRKLEFLIGDAIAEGADTIVTFGAVQSNHARQTAAACAKVGLECHQVLSRQVQRNHPSYETGGNVLLGNLLGAHQHIVAADDIKAYSQSLLARLKADGRAPYIVPAGGSNALGALGYATCAEELAVQFKDADIMPSCVIHASSSAGTQAGLLSGFAQLGLELAVMGINVYHNNPDHLTQNVERLVHEIRDTYFNSYAQPPLPVSVNHAYFGDGYGQPTAECLAAIHTVAELEGLLFDPVYSGKALAALIDQITLGNFADSSDVVLIHTGGTPALYVYDDVLVE